MALSILVPLDGSRCAEAARRVALQLAQNRQPATAGGGVRVVALHVVNVRPGSGNILEDLTGRLGFEPAVVDEDTANAAKAEGQAILDAFVAEGAAVGVTVEPVLEVGGVAHTILKHSQDADLVVMGLRGETDERFHGQGGEMAAWLPPRVDTPVLMLPRGVQRLERVAIGYDGSDGARHALRAVRTLIEGQPVALDAIYVSRDGSDGRILDEVDKLLPGTTVAHHVVTGTDVHAVLAREAQQLGVTALALGFHGKNKLKDFLFGTVTEKIAIDGTLGVLVAH